jgi:hypothetical protein
MHIINYGRRGSSSFGSVFLTNTRQDVLEMRRYESKVEVYSWMSPNRGDVLSHFRPLPKTEVETCEQLREEIFIRLHVDVLV